MAERMFDKDSFLDEVDSPGQAEQCVEYLALNEHKFRQELQDEGLSYDEVENELKTVWTNLIKSCQKVGYSDSLIEGKAKRYGIK
jgi:hypothetical protein